MIKIKDEILNRIIKESIDNVLNEKYYRYSKTNNSPLIPILEKSNAKRLIDKHTKDGYAILSASRGFSDFGLDDTNINDIRKHNEFNNQRTKSLIKDIEDKGFSYTPLYGGFIENQGADNEEEVYEQSVIVYPYICDKETHKCVYAFDELYQFALEMCAKHNQDSVLIKAPNKNPQYINQNGEIEMTFTGKPIFNDISQRYFSDLHKNTNKKINNNTRPTRFTFTESYISQIPQSYSESHIRYLNGEKFLTKK